jgi:hypothetical protein
VADRWLQRTDLADNPIIDPKRSVFHAPIPELDAIVYFSHLNAERKLWVFRYAADGPGPAGARQARGAGRETVTPTVAVTDVPAPAAKGDASPAIDAQTAPVSRASAAVPRRGDATGICAQPGILVCEEFDDEPAGLLTPGAAMPTVADGLLTLTIPSGSPANAGGAYRVTFPPIGEGGLIAFHYRIRADAAALALPGRKEFILWRGAASCTDLQLAQSHRYDTPVVAPYTACGSGSTTIKLPGGDYLVHYPDYDCRYHALKRGDYAGCVISEPDVWDDYYVEVAIGHYGAPDSRLTMWHRKDGGPWKRYIDTATHTFRGHGGFEQFMLTAYMTGKKPVPHPPGRVDYDRLIIATEPFLDALRD